MMNKLAACFTILVTSLVTRTVLALPGVVVVNDDEESRVMKLLDRVPLIDGHNDMPWQLRKHLKDQLKNVDLRNESITSKGHTSIPLLRKGKVSGQFWSAYVRCATQEKTVVRNVLEQIDVIKRFAAEYDDTFQFVTTANGILQAHKEGKIASLIGIESGHAIDSSLSVLRMMYELGARYMTLTHFCTNPWARKDGLTEFGKEVIREMNRLGMMIDLSHVPYQARLDVFQVTKAPVIFSHTSAYGVCNDTTNARDDILEKVKQNGGIVMVNFILPTLNCDYKTNVTTIEDVVKHIDYIKQKIGIDYIGIGTDFDGVPEVPKGLENVSKFPSLFITLAKKGYKDDELEKIAGKNLIRTFEKVEKVARELRDKKNKPIESLMPADQFMYSLANNSCRNELLETMR